MSSRRGLPGGIRQGASNTNSGIGARLYTNSTTIVWKRRRYQVHKAITSTGLAAKWVFRRFLLQVTIAIALASTSFAANEALASATPDTSTPAMPNCASQALAASQHRELTLREARGCAPGATLLAPGARASQPGLYIMQNSRGFGLMGSGYTTNAPQVSQRSALAYSCGSYWNVQNHQWENWVVYGIDLYDNYTVFVCHYSWNTWHHYTCFAAGNCTVQDQGISGNRTSYVTGYVDYQVNFTVPPWSETHGCWTTQKSDTNLTRGGWCY